VFGVYLFGVAGLSLAWNYPSLLGFRLITSLALGAEWGISHAFLNERVEPARCYRLAALLQFAILGGLLAALAQRYLLPVCGWRSLFAASLVPVALLSLARWRLLAGDREVEGEGRKAGDTETMANVVRASLRPFLLCLGLASLTIASGTVNVFFVKELPQSPLYTVLFWADLAPGWAFAPRWRPTRWR
jgi:putative MFS transporter